MKVGDLVRHRRFEKVGVILRERKNAEILNKIFDICWKDGTLEPDVWDHSLELIKNESAN